MLNTITQLKIGTRSSKLALKQTKLVLKRLENLTEIKKIFLLKLLKLKLKVILINQKFCILVIKVFLQKRLMIYY